MSSPHLVAHRGYAAMYPENTLLALKEAIAAGALFVEFDVQLCADGTPVLFHDLSLRRTTGRGGEVCDLNTAEIKDIEAAETLRFGDIFSGQGITIPRLSEATALLKQHPQVTAFIELKEESFQKHGRAAVLEAVLACTDEIRSQCVYLSYDSEMLVLARTLGIERIAWVLKTWSKASEDEAVALAPDFIFGNHRKIPTPETALWAGPWQWCFYEVVDPELALALHRRGANFIETMEIGKMICDPRLKPDLPF